jgi:hypothetical protein
MPSAATEKFPKKKIHLNFFETACTGNHECAGQWRYFSHRISSGTEAHKETAHPETTPEPEIA